MTEVITQEQLSQFVANNSNNNLVANSTLRADDHKIMAEKLVGTAKEKLVGVLDLYNRGLVVTLPNWGFTLYQYEKISGMTDAEVTMEASTDGQNDRQTFTQATLPVPVIHKDFQLGARQWQASQNSGSGLDLTQLSESARNVSDKLEDMLFNGLPSLIVSGSQIYGYTNHPERTTLTLAGTGWGTSSGRDIIGDTKNMLQAMYDANRYGPFVMYVAKNVWAELELDYSTSKGDRTFKERIEAFEGIEAVKCSTKLADDDVVLVQMTDDVVKMILAKDISYVQYSNDPFTTKFKTVMAAAPLIMSDKNGSCAVVHGSPS
jgi:uncharacterized linocin/CFP29 family protein